MMIVRVDERLRKHSPAIIRPMLDRVETLTAVALIVITWVVVAVFVVGPVKRPYADQRVLACEASQDCAAWQHE